MRLVSEAPGRGVKVFIVGAGAAAHLAGVVAAHSTLPVDRCTDRFVGAQGARRAAFTVQMPPGVPVATVSIGKPGATNAGVLARRSSGRGSCDGRPSRRLKKKLLKRSKRRPRARAMKYSIVTFGCRVNQADSLHLEEQLRARGAEPATEAADFVIVNTCSVTATADQGARQTKAHRSRQSFRQDRRHRLLRHTSARGCRVAAKCRRRRP